MTSESVGASAKPGTTQASSAAAGRIFGVSPVGGSIASAPVLERLLIALDWHQTLSHGDGEVPVPRGIASVPAWAVGFSNYLILFSWHSDSEGGDQWGAGTWTGTHQAVRLRAHVQSEVLGRSSGEASVTHRVQHVQGWRGQSKGCCCVRGRSSLSVEGGGVPAERPCPGQQDKVLDCAAQSAVKCPVWAQGSLWRRTGS